VSSRQWRRLHGVEVDRTVADERYLLAIGGERKGLLDQRNLRSIGREETMTVRSTVHADLFALKIRFMEGLPRHHGPNNFDHADSELLGRNRAEGLLDLLRRRDSF